MPLERLFLGERRPQALAMCAVSMLDWDFATFRQAVSKLFDASLPVFDDIFDREYCNVFCVDYCNTLCHQRGVFVRDTTIRELKSPPQRKQRQVLRQKNHFDPALQNCKIQPAKGLKKLLRWALVQVGRGRDIRG